METIVYKTEGTCSREIEIEIEDNIVKNVKFVGGCPGNTLGLSALCVGQNVDYLIEKLQGIKCRTKPTSCPDQLSKALLKYKKGM